VCGRYTLATPDPAAVRARFAVGESVEIRCRYNIAPGDDVLAVTTDSEGSPRGELLRWGLVPSWARRADTGLRMINARVETASQRPAFRRAFERFRCLIIADGFYEWQAVPAGPKQPFHITRADGDLFAFAGLWSSWHAKDGGKLRTCAILTTAANSMIAPLNNRMPVILAPEAETAWLDASTAPDQLAEIVAGVAPGQTVVAPPQVALHPVGLAVNDARYDGPDCLAPPIQCGQEALF
jgi:putative SOS response-associated peptidase YedK